MMKPRFEDYPIELKPLPAEDGGGWLACFPDLPGCMGDGATPEDAIADARGAFDCWMTAVIEDGRSIPAPSSGGESGRFVLRTPRSLHARLAARAEQEGVSMNTLAVALLAEGLATRRDSAAA
jgi:antitoxin HicB